MNGGHATYILKNKKIRIMKNSICLAIVVLLFSFPVFSQFKKANFFVVKVGTKYSEPQLVKAFTNANMCGQFLMSKSNDITLDDGSIIRFLSKKEIGLNGTLSDDCFLPDNTKFPKVFWSILANGYVGKGISVAPNKNNFKNNK